MLSNLQSLPSYTCEGVEQLLQCCLPRVICHQAGDTQLPISKLSCTFTNTRRHQLSLISWVKLLPSFSIWPLLVFPLLSLMQKIRYDELQQRLVLQHHYHIPLSYLEAKAVGSVLSVHISFSSGVPSPSPFPCPSPSAYPPFSLSPSPFRPFSTFPVPVSFLVQDHHIFSLIWNQRHFPASLFLPLPLFLSLSLSHPHASKAI